MEQFPYSEDIYHGIQLSSDAISWSSLEEFGKRLEDNLSQWTEAGVRGVWIKVYLKDAVLVGEIAKHQFRFHHAQGDYVMMIRWLPTKEPDMLPSFANHYIGVGGLVVNKEGQILVIKELYTWPSKKWKLPGGAVDTGEYLSDAVMREVLEETGVATEFKSILCFRHLQNFRYGQSDFYFVCILKPLSDKISPCPAEISSCRWMDIDEFLSSEEVHAFNKEVIQRYRERKYTIERKPFKKCEIYSSQSIPSTVPVNCEYDMDSICTVPEVNSSLVGEKTNT